MPIYNSKIHKPKWIRHVKSGKWRDEMNKLVGEPEINLPASTCWWPQFGSRCKILLYDRRPRQDVSLIFWIGRDGRAYSNPKGR